VSAAGHRAGIGDGAAGRHRDQRRTADDRRGDDYARPAAFSAGFSAAMAACAVLMAVGGLVAWATIRADALRT
jgi:hypothetical protein